MSKDTQSRKWQITINNPIEKGYTHERIKEELEKRKSIIYWCLCDEVGKEKNTYHTHIYIYSPSGIRFSTVKNMFDGGHFEQAKGTSQQNRDYIRKDGKWERDKKADTNLKDTFEEFGEIPIEKQGQRNDINDLYDMIKRGYTNYDILEEEPTYMLQIEKIEKVRQILKEEEFKNKFRELEVSYIWGSTETGKTRFIMDTYGYDNVYRVTDYQHPFDGYNAQDVILFEEFRSDLKIGDMLKYLEGYPINLPARYNNKVACFTKIYIISNIPINRQYTTIQVEQIETWKAFLRRIKNIVYFSHGNILQIDKEEYIENNYQLPKVLEINPRLYAK